MDPGEGKKAGGVKIPYGMGVVGGKRHASAQKYTTFENLTGPIDPFLILDQSLHTQCQLGGGGHQSPPQQNQKNVVTFFLKPLQKVTKRHLHHLLVESNYYGKGREGPN